MSRPVVDQFYTAMGMQLLSRRDGIKHIEWKVILNQTAVVGLQRELPLPKATRRSSLAKPISARNRDGCFGQPLY